MQNYFEGSAYSKVATGANTMKLLKKKGKVFLKTLGMQRFID